jgi:UDP-N-acetyl-D-galactosamine dehydrogenase
MIHKEVKVKGSKVLILGVTFKENCPDIRNTKVIDMYLSLKSFGVDIDIYDPWVKNEDVKSEYNIQLIDNLGGTKYNAIVLAVAHHQFKTIDILNLKKKNAVVYDIKDFLEIKDKSL